jgi:hypothetical protein
MPKKKDEKAKKKNKGKKKRAKKSCVAFMQSIPKNRIRLTPEGNRLICDEEFTAKVLGFHKDCCITILAVGCCPERDPGKGETAADEDDPGKVPLRGC